MRLEDVNPDVVLAEALDGRLTVETSETESHTVRCYADGRMPNMGLGDEFVTVLMNGPVRSRTNTPGLLRGSLMLSVACKMHSDGTSRTLRLRSLIAQAARLVEGKCLGGFIFRIDPSQVITPVTPNLNTGYSTTVLNVEWRCI